ncbi:MAG: hypothetical protein LBS17_03750 [Actinomycetes bacterium]|jgi:glutamate synthase domain-containing protein 3|nr:hypothetical protein [Actinomycetes bacterium]
MSAVFDTNPATAAPIEGYRPVAPVVERDGATAVVDADHVYYRELNEAIQQLVADGVRDLTIRGVNGQRYIGNGLTETDLRIRIQGVPGQDLGMFLGGPVIDVDTNAQDGVGNTMESGEICVHGSAGDVVGYGMRGGRILIRGDAGYRVGIHMKQYQNQLPEVIIGGKARDFFGEYMAGGRLVLLDLNSQLAGPALGNYTGTGMHGGEIFVRGTVDACLCGREVGVVPATPEQLETIRPLVTRYCEAFGADADGIMSQTFTRIAPVSSRPYGNLYCSM